MDAKRLLVTSDDFGMCHAINTGIVRAMTAGIVTSTNLMAPCPWIVEAVALAKRHNLPCGVHFTLTCEWDRLRWRPLTAGASLRDAAGFLPETVQAVADQASDADVLEELNAQIMALRSLGVQPTHADVHMIAADDRRPGAIRLMGLIKRVATAQGLPLLREIDASARHVYVDDETYCSGRPLEQVWETLESWTQPGIYHLIGHAGEASAELESMCSTETICRPWAQTYRAADLAFLTDPATRERIEAMGFELVTVRQLLGK